MRGAGGRDAPGTMAAGTSVDSLYVTSMDGVLYRATGAGRRGFQREIRSAAVIVPAESHRRGADAESCSPAADRRMKETGFAAGRAAKSLPTDASRRRPGSSTQRFSTTLRSWIARYRQRQTLGELVARNDEHLLKDIGVTRGEALREAAKWFWQP